MRAFLSFVHKEFLHIIRDRRTVLILLVMPLLQIMIFGFAISTEVRNLRFAVYDTSKDDVSMAIVEKFAANKYFSFVDDLTSHHQIPELLKRGDADIVLVFADNFSSDMLADAPAQLSLMVDATDPNKAAAAANYANAIVSSYVKENHTGAGVNVVMPINLSSSVLYNPQMEGAYNFVPGVLGLVLMLICAMMTSVAIVREKERGSMELLLTSPMNPAHITIAKLVPYFSLSVINLVTALLLSRYVLGVPLSGSLVLLFALSLIYIMVALLFGLLISNKVATQVAAMLISAMALMFPTIMLSGMMFPIENMPTPLFVASHLIPARWYIEAMRKLMIQGVDGGYIVKEFAVLFAMLTVLLVANIKSFKKRL